MSKLSAKYLRAGKSANGKSDPNVMWPASAKASRLGSAAGLADSAVLKYCQFAVASQFLGQVAEGAPAVLEIRQVSVRVRLGHRHMLLSPKFP